MTTPTGDLGLDLGLNRRQLLGQFCTSLALVHWCIGALVHWCIGGSRPSMVDGGVIGGLVIGGLVDGGLVDGGLVDGGWWMVV